MHNKPETLGDIIKFAREQSNYTVEELAYLVGISERYLYKIENEGKKPSYDVLYKLIRTLSIPSDSIFYPEKTSTSYEIENLFHILSSYDVRSLNIIKAIAKILMETTN